MLDFDKNLKFIYKINFFNQIYYFNLGMLETVMTVHSKNLHIDKVISGHFRLLHQFWTKAYL